MKIIMIIKYMTTTAAGDLATTTKINKYKGNDNKD